MKIIIIVLVALAVLVAVFLVSCGPVLVGSGKLSTIQTNLSGFTKVDISSAFQFEIVRADNFSVTVTADDNIIDRIETTLEGRTLRIKLKPFSSIGPATLKAAISMPELEALSVSGACLGNITGFNSTKPFLLDASGASRIAGNIALGDVKISLSGASVADLAGTASSLSASASGASKLNLGGFAVNNAKINLSGASTGEVNCTGKLDADLSGASKLVYAGNPAMGNVNTSGASTISKK